VRSLAEEKLKRINESYEWMRGMEKVSVCSANEWKPIDEVSRGDVAKCANCQQENRLPEKNQIIVARCGVCHAYLAWNQENGHFFSQLFTDQQ
jgi:hypothetical protein